MDIRAICDVRRRAAIDRNVMMIAVAGVLIVAAGVIYFVRSGGEKPDTSGLDDQMQTVTCSNCGATWQMSLNDYNEAAQKAAEKGQSGILCEKCGQATAWKENQLKVRLLNPTETKGEDQAKDQNEEPEDYGQAPAVEEKKPQAMAVTN